MGAESACTWRSGLSGEEEKLSRTVTSHQLREQPGQHRGSLGGISKGPVGRAGQQWAEVGKPVRQAQDERGPCMGSTEESQDRARGWCSELSALVPGSGPVS